MTGQRHCMGAGRRAGLILLLLAAPAGLRAEWSFEPPSAVGAASDFLYDVDGVAPDDVWAVGTWEPPDTDRLSLLEHFDGSSWTRFPSPDTGVIGPFETLFGVAATAADRALAVGSYTPIGSTAQPLAMDWDGSSWELVDAPTFAGGGAFQSAGRTPGGEIWVAGFRAGTAFVTHWSGGGSWEIESAPPVSGFRNRFYSIDARADDEIWVGGTHGEGFGDFRILLQRYDGGGNWTTFDLPTPGWLDSITGIVALAADDVWAAGYYYDPTLSLTQPLLMHYDGADWTQVILPPFTEGSAELRDITATASDDVIAAGTYATAQGLPRPFVLHYDGMGWSEVDLPQTGGSGEWFRGLGATPQGTVWAVGQYFDGNSTEPMAFVRATGTSAVVLEGTAPQAAGLVAAPNPFRTATSMRFSLAETGPVRLRIHDASGRLVRMLLDRELRAGAHVVAWDGVDARGRSVPAGVYFYRLETTEGNERRKIVRTR